MRLPNTRSIFFLVFLVRTKSAESQVGENAGVNKTDEISGISCDFDCGLCGWTHGNDVEFTWSRNKGKTPSSDTGPPWDHTTKQADQGSYLYIEASTPRRLGDRARLVSAPLTSPGTYCLRFWHHMYGAQVRDLNVYVKEGTTAQMKTLIHFSGPWSTERTLRLRSSGTNGDYWNEQITEFTVETPVRLIFEGVRGSNYQGDIAIDDISLTQSICPSSSIDCDFETNTCGWSQMSGDNFNWLPNKGATSTNLTGPLTDHTFEDADGRYLYIEASWPRTEGDKARLISPPIRCVQNASPLFRFWYNMRGTSIGSIRVYVVANETSARKAIWQVGGEQGEAWFQAEIAIPSTYYENQKKFHIIIEGERKEYRGDAAIDDVTLTGCTSESRSVIVASASSKILPTTRASRIVNTLQSVSLTEALSSATLLSELLSCNFENETTCGWAEDTSGTFAWELNRGMTPTLSTGPTHDHTTSNGWYIFTEASSPRVEGDRAILRSPTISANVRLCLNFFYHMYGNTVGRLEVLTARPRSNSFSVKWFVQGEQSRNQTDWKRAELVISEEHDFDVAIRGIRGSDFYSDIALDDISVSATCSGPILPEDLQVANRLTPIEKSQPKTFTLINCTFDNFHICNWIQLQDDDFDFHVSRDGKTSSRNTGPIGDRNGGSGFAYIEASPPRQPDDKAKIQSPSFTVTSTACFSMWYHMYGNDIGSLAVYQVTAAGQTNVSEIQLWKSIGSLEDQWRHLQLNLNRNEMKLVVEAVRGPGYRGDIAIDDISLKEGECPTFNCTLESGLCGWKQDKKLDGFDWTRTRDNTPSLNTGPAFDHTRNTSGGYFLYIETSRPRKPGDRARLISPIVQPSRNSSEKCLQFWYHSYGRDIGSLNVYKRNLNSKGLSESILWYHAENEGDQWLLAKITIEDNFPYQVIFEGIRGVSYQGDIAIDDITITENRCPTCCGDQVFRCGNNFCINSTLRCNGVDDCGDGSDESFCRACGQSFVTPITSQRYGTVTPLKNLNVSYPLNKGSFTLNNRRVTQIELEQLPRIQHPNFKVSPANNDSDRGGESGDLLAPRYQQIEVIKLRRKREIESFKFSKINSRLLQSFKEKQTLNSINANINYIRNNEPMNEKIVMHNKNMQNKNRFSDLKEKFLNDEKSEERQSTDDKKQHQKRFPQRIPSWQWNFMKKSRKRDKEPAESEGLIERVKRQVMLRITEGNEALQYSWPWQAAYYVTNTQTESYYFCGATLIAPYWAVTAAHCPQLGDLHSIVLGDHDLYINEGTEQEVKVEAVYIHHAFKGISTDLAGDIALIKLKYPARTNGAVQPACLLSSTEPSFEPGYVCAVTGWGRTNVEESGVQRILRQGEVPLLPHETCQSTYTTSIHDSMFCAGGTGANSCRGDSGGPLVCIRNNTSYLVGVTSWGDDKCSPNIPGVYTKVRSYMDWMRRIMEKANYCSTTA